MGITTAWLLGCYCTTAPNQIRDGQVGDLQQYTSRQAAPADSMLPTHSAHSIYTSSGLFKNEMLLVCFVRLLNVCSSKNMITDMYTCSCKRFPHATHRPLKRLRERPAGSRQPLFPNLLLMPASDTRKKGYFAAS